MNNLRKYRAKTQLSQSALAVQVGVSQPMVASLEQNKKNPSLVTAQRVVTALNRNGVACTIQDVFPVSELQQAS